MQVAAEDAERLALARASRCPAGHALKKRYAPAAPPQRGCAPASGCSCSVCQAQVKRGGDLWSCPSCSFNRCQKCAPVQEERGAGRPAAGECWPHVPLLEEVALPEGAQERWEASGGTELDQVLGSGEAVLVDAWWMVEPGEQRVA
ncbi:unnamed protein product [Prorocentrum cordatum]|uniref:Uncharacterized protein n=1 Tax=Prorocentrum cordatum TaxID=2364126 RepID=A0ABN9S9D3_9DINO|nr:unnamed protein product [Polarella glacialis]